MWGVWEVLEMWRLRLQGDCRGFSGPRERGLSCWLWLLSEGLSYSPGGTVPALCMWATEPPDARLPDSIRFIPGQPGPLASWAFTLVAEIELWERQARIGLVRRTGMGWWDAV